MQEIDRILKRLISLRKRYGRGQKQLARLIGLSDHTTYSRKEQGKVPFYLHELCVIVNELGATWEEVFGFEEAGTYHVKAEEICQKISHRKEDIISYGDLVIVSVLEEPKHNDYVLAELNGRYTCGRLKVSEELLTVVPIDAEEDQLLIIQDVKKKAVIRKIKEIRKRFD
jgi:transcriptional regulator with XRE-family HTH domain